MSDSKITRVKGFVSPRFLDPKWFKLFTVDRSNRKNNDIPGIVEFCHASYTSYQNDNDLVTYGDVILELAMVKDKFKQQSQLIKDLLEVVGIIGGGSVGSSLREVRSKLTTDKELVEMAFRYNEKARAILESEAVKQFKEDNK